MLLCKRLSLVSGFRALSYSRAIYLEVFNLHGPVVIVNFYAP
jgi:hypothetical protein